MNWWLLSLGGIVILIISTLLFITAIDRNKEVDPHIHDMEDYVFAFHNESFAKIDFDYVYSDPPIIQEDFFNTLGSNNFAIELKFKQNHTGQIQDLFFKGYSRGKWFALTIRHEGVINTQFQDGNGSKILRGILNVTDGEWHTVKSEYLRKNEGWEINHYVDNVLENNTSYRQLRTLETSCPISLAGPLDSCESSILNVYRYDGEVEYLKIWNNNSLVIFRRNYNVER